MACAWMLSSAFGRAERTRGGSGIYRVRHVGLGLARKKSVLAWGLGQGCVLGRMEARRGKRAMPLFLLRASRGESVPRRTRTGISAVLGGGGGSLPARRSARGRAACRSSEWYRGLRSTHTGWQRKARLAP